MKIKKIPNHEGYFATEDGHIYSSFSKRLLSEQVYCGYKYVGIRGKKLRVHRLIAITFIPNPHDYPCVNHIDENKCNNATDNLEWCTYQYNNNYGKGQPTKKAIAAKKKPVVQLSIDGNFIQRFDSATQAQKTLSGSENGNGSNVAAICRGKRKDMKTAYGYKWMFERDYLLLQNKQVK